MTADLDLSQLGLCALPPEIGQLSNLVGLVLSRNQLSTLPPEIGLLSALAGLYLSGNQLSTLPPERHRAHFTGAPWGLHILRLLLPELISLLARKFRVCFILQMAPTATVPRRAWNENDHNSTIAHGGTPAFAKLACLREYPGAQLRLSSAYQKKSRFDEDFSCIGGEEL
jgi:Leucine-rich repeat (LRR) protein